MLFQKASIPIFKIPKRHWENLLCNRLIELPGSNQTFGENKNSFTSQGTLSKGDKIMLYNA